MLARLTRAPLVVALLAAFALLTPVAACAGDDAPSAAPVRAAAEIPWKTPDELGLDAAGRRELDTTIELIRSGGPFPYRQDGSVFGNREGILPDESSGYYHEYTVKTPGSSDRGARRIVTGSSDEWYYTADHYESFVRLRL